MPAPEQRMAMVGDLARKLRAEAVAADERRLLVLAGAADRTRSCAREALEAAEIPASETTVVGPTTAVPGEHLPTERAGELLGRTRTAVVLDCHGTFRPNALGRTVGAVDGGGLYVLCTPPLDDWPAHRDESDEWLAVPPFDVADVTGNVRARTVDLLRAHPGIAIVDVQGDTDGDRIECDGLTEPAPRCEPPAPTPPREHAFPRAAYEACLTDDQVDVVESFEPLAEPGHALVLEADRGRGKSAAAGLAAASLATTGQDVLVTAPRYRSAGEVFDRATALLDALDVGFDRDRESNPKRIETGGGAIRFAKPADATSLPDDPDLVIVDEAAGLPVGRLETFLDAPSVAFTTTIHGYEGAGRGFSVRFRDRLRESDLEIAERAMTTPIRYADADPIETWAFRTLVLDARPAVGSLVEGVTPEATSYEALSPERLLDDEHLLREAFGLLVLAHYRTEPDDLARLLDAPNVSARALLQDGHVVSVALLAREGALPSDERARMYRGGRIRGNMIPDVLTTQLRDEDAGTPVGQRILRIATHPAVRSRGLGSRLLSEIRTEFAEDVDWLGTGYGATPELVRFWADNGYRTVHLSTTRNDASGEHSAVMLDPCSDAGRTLFDRHTDRFCDRLPSVLTDALADVDPDVVRAVLASVDGTPTLDLSGWEWRLVAGVPGGAATIDTDPGPFRRLVLRHLVDPLDESVEESPLDPDVERVLVRKVLQTTDWAIVADELNYVSTAECKRAAGRGVRTLVETYGTTYAREELGRYDG